MIHALGLALWRALLLVTLGLAPWGAPLEGRVAASLGGTLLHAALVLGAVGVVAWALRATRGREPWARAVALALTTVAGGLALWFGGDDGPLARGVWVVSPLAWGLVGLLATDAVVVARGNEGARPRVRAAFVLLALVASGVSLFAARARLVSRAHLWEQILAVDPGHEPAALVVAAARRAAGDGAGSFAVLRACGEAPPEHCRCAEGGAAEGIDLGEYAVARALLDGTASCESSPLRAGVAAEAAVGTGDLEGGIAAADALLRQSPEDPRALYARGWALSLRGDIAGARPWVARASAAGRGLPADLLLGTILFQLGDTDAAEGAFRKALAADPRNARATYDLALIAHQRGRYHDAREGYLRALELDPKYLEARYNLALLTHAHGADAEARHHLDELAKIAPDDPRVAELRAVLLP